MPHQLLQRVFLAASLLISGTIATIKASDIKLTRTDIWDSRSDTNCAYGIQTHISDGFELQIDISTHAMTSNYLAAVGPGIHESAARRECYGEAQFHNTGPISELRLGNWTVQGKVTLGKGLIANVTIFADWRFRYASEIMTSTSVSGPTTEGQIYSTVIGQPGPVELPGYCTGLEPDKRTWQPASIGLHTIFEIYKSPEAENGTSGRIGDNTDGALTLASKLNVLDGCSRQKPTCSTDRDGFELCLNYGD